MERSSREFDTLARKGERKGLMITVQTMGEVGTARDSEERSEGLDFLKARVEGMYMRDVPGPAVLRYLCEGRRGWYKVDHRGVIMHGVGSDSLHAMEERTRAQ